ncbi:MAG TPA: hypothetical protein ACFYEE_08955 [Candidatus Wujingus californicus]|uniref:hypothetical protein n=1 Tax=Candidatus Wujingus californicus TaxID=3367618 RepID=UPI004024C006
MWSQVINLYKNCNPSVNLGQAAKVVITECFSRFTAFTVIEDYQWIKNPLMAIDFI